MRPIHCCGGQHYEPCMKWRHVTWLIVAAPVGAIAVLVLGVGFAEIIGVIVLVLLLAAGIAARLSDW